MHYGLKATFFTPGIMLIRPLSKRKGPQGREHFGDLDVDGKFIIKRILDKLDVKM